MCNYILNIAVFHGYGKRTTLQKLTDLQINLASTFFRSIVIDSCLQDN
uniref:Uncharacterized protein n=1 Tax=Arundo donax TaxID=35708 RepID=A0A0A9FDZ3_ARUDO